MRHHIAVVALIFSSGFALADTSPSFDCSKASNTVERLICSDNSLAELDVMLSQKYKAALAEASDKTVLKQRQIEWIKGVRSKCTDAVCIADEYKKRISEISGSSADDTKAVAIESPPTALTQPEPEANNVVQPNAAASIASSNIVNSIATNSTAIESASKPEIKVEPNNQQGSSTSSIGKPSAGFISETSAFIQGIIALALIIGLVNPAWILRKSANPTRKKLFLYVLLVGLPIGGLAEYTKSKEAKAYEANVKAVKQAEHDASVAKTNEEYRRIQEQKVENQAMNVALSDSDKQGYCKMLAINVVMTGTLNVSDERMSDLIDENLDVMTNAVAVENKALIRKKISSEMHRVLPSSRTNVVNTVKKVGDQETIRILSQRCYQNQKGS